MIKHLLKLTWARKRSNALLIIEVLFAFLVVYAVAVLGIFYVDSYNRPLGFAYENVWVASIDTQKREAWDSTDTARLERLMTTVREMPEIREVAATAFTPYISASFTDHIEYDGKRVECLNTFTGDDYQKVLGLELVRGRWFQQADDGFHWTPVVLNERAVKALFGDENPLGKRVSPALFVKEREYRVVGVVKEYREGGEYAPQGGYMFRRGKLADGELNTLIFSTHGSLSADWEERLTHELLRVAPDWTVDLQSLAEKRESFNRYKLLAFQATSVIAGFLMLMVALGLCGVLWQSVTRRTQEFGLRRALGGSAASVRRQVILELMLVVSIGIVAAIFLVMQLPLLGLMGFIGGHVYAVAMAVSLVIVYGIAILAGLYPAWLTTRIHPAMALHYE